MDAYWLDWANLLLRWAHVITGIAWIGSSFYFVSLDNSLTPPTDPKDPAKGVGGEQWAVHGGGFYHHLKYPVPPALLRATALVDLGELLDLAHRLRAVHGAVPVQRQHLPDRQELFDWTPAAAIATALGFFVAFWLVYDAICRAFGRGGTATRSSARGVRLHRVRVLAVVPSVRGPRRVPAGRRDDRDDDERQRVVLDHPGPAQSGGRDPAGQPVDPSRPARQAAQRAQHLLHAAGVFTMLSNHYGFTYGAKLQLAGAGGAHGRGRADPHVVRAAPQGARLRQAGAVAVRGRRHAGSSASCSR